MSSIPAPTTTPSPASSTPLGFAHRIAHRIAHRQGILSDEAACPPPRLDRPYRQEVPTLTGTTDGFSERTLLEKIEALYALQSNMAIVGIDVAADDAMMQLKAARLILEMKRVYEELGDESAVRKNGGDFAESDEQSRDISLKSSFLDAKTSELLTEMRNVEEKIANNVDEGYDYLFQTSERVTVEDKASSLRALLDNIIEEGVDVLATDGLLQLQTSICVLEMLQIYTSMAAADDLATSKENLESFIEKEDCPTPSNVRNRRHRDRDEPRAKPTTPPTKEPTTRQTKGHVSEARRRQQPSS